MMDYWVGFARTGDPGGAGRPPWRPYADRESFMLFSERPVAATDLLPGMFEMHEAWVSARHQAGEPYFLNVGVAAAPGRGRLGDR
jgi:para-nitrobenzyl esterase